MKNKKDIDLNSGILSGPGNDKRHQLVIAYLIHGLINRFNNNKHFKNYIALPELSLLPLNSKIPDVTIWKNNSCVVIVEVCKNQKVSSDIDKIIEIMNVDKTIKEGFVIDKGSLEINKVYRKKDGKPSKAVKNSKSEALKCSLSEFLKSDKIRYFF